MATLEFVWTYLDDLLCISQGNLDDHLTKLGRILIRLWNASLKVNAHKSCFCAMETEYLGYILSQDKIKPQPKKIQAILALAPPQNVKQLHRFLGMVQYYRDIWARCSEILAPLSDLVGECGQTTQRVTRQRKSHGIEILSISKNSMLSRQLLLTMLPWPNLIIHKDLRYTQRVPSYSYEP